MFHLVRFQLLLIFHPAQHRQIDGVLILGAGGQGRAQDHFVRAVTAHGERVTQSQLVLRQRAGLIGAEDVDPGQFFDSCQAGDDGFPGCQHSGTHSHGDRQNSRHRHRHGGDRQHQRELQRGDHLIAPEQGHGQDQGHQNQGQNDQIVADFQDGPLEMTHRVGHLHQVSRLAEVGVRARTVHQGVDLPLLDDGARIDDVARAAGHRQGLTGQGRLVHLQRFAVQQTGIGRHGVAESQADDVARNQLPSGHRRPRTIPLHPGIQRQFGFQRLDSIAGLILFPEAHDSVHDQQNRDNNEIGPVVYQQRQDSCCLNHPRDWSPEV